MERLAHNHSDDTSELLSAYVDNEITVVERRRAEELVQACTACAQEVRELQLFKELLHDLPLVQPRRSFMIDPQRAPRPRWLLFPTFRFATVIATALLFVVLGVDALGSRNFAAAGSATSVTSAEQQDRAFSALRVPESGATGSDTSGAAASTAAAAEAPQAAASTAALAAASAEASAAAGTGAEASAAASVPAPESAAAPDAAAGSTASDAAATAGTASDGGDNAAAANSPAEPAGGTTSQLQANEPLSPDTLATKQAEDSVQRSAVNTLQIAEIALGLLALGFGAAAIWAWRRGA